MGNTTYNTEENSAVFTFQEDDHCITYSQKLVAPDAGELIQAFLAAYGSFGFGNDLEVVLRNPFMGDTKYLFTTENWIEEVNYQPGEDADKYTVTEEALEKLEAFDRIERMVAERFPFMMKELGVEKVIHYTMETMFHKD